MNNSWHTSNLFKTNDLFIEISLQFKPTKLTFLVLFKELDTHFQTCNKETKSSLNLIISTGVNPKGLMKIKVLLSKK